MNNIQHSTSLVNSSVYSGKNKSLKPSQSGASQKPVLSNRTESSSSNNNSSFLSKTKSLASNSSFISKSSADSNNISASKFLVDISDASDNTKLTDYENRSISIYSLHSVDKNKNDNRIRSPRDDSYSKAQSCNGNELEHLSSRSQRKLGILPMIPQMAKDWMNYPYAAPGASEVGNTYPHSCRSLEIVPGWREGGCGVTCIAMVTGLSYKECRDKALVVGGFSPNGGMELSGICQTLRALGANSDIKYFANWKELPDLAIIGVWVGSQGHAVVFKRKNGREYIFDRNMEVPLSPERFSLMDNYYVSIDYSGSKSMNLKNNLRAHINTSSNSDTSTTRPQYASKSQLKASNRHLLKGNENPALAPVESAPLSGLSWEESIKRIDKELDRFFGIVDDGMSICFGAIDKAKYKYIEVNRKFLDFLEKL